jgi:hypothetical protein
MGCRLILQLAPALAVRRQPADDGAMSRANRYLVLLRRELVRAQARLKRAERERDAALAENAKLKTLVKRTRPRRSPRI